MTDKSKDAQLDQLTDSALKIIMEASPVGIIVFGSDARIIYANPLASKIFSKSATEISGLRCGDFIDCANRHKDNNGCGFSDSCADCPLFQAICSSVSGGSNEVLKEGEAFLERDTGLSNIWVQYKVNGTEMQGRKILIMAVDDITKHKIAQEASYRQKVNSELLMNTIPSPIFYKNTDGIYTDCNQAFEEFIGRSREQIIGKSVYDMAPKAISDKYKEKDDELFKKSGKQRYEWKVKVKDGLRDVIFDKATILSSQNHPEGLVGIITDITDRKNAEQALKESEEKHRRLFQTMSQGVIYQDATGAIISANPAAERILGLSLDQMLGKTSMDPHWKMIREDGSDVPGNEHPAMLALQTGQKVGPVTRGVFNQHLNSHKWLTITAIPLFNPGETKPFQAYATFVNITERIRAQKALQESERKYRELFESSRDGFVIVDAEGRFIDANLSYCGMLGYSLDELRQHEKFYEITPERWREWEKEEIWGKRLLREGFTGVYEKEYICKYGKVLPVELQSYAVRNEKGEILYLWGIVRDITYRKKAEEELRVNEEFRKRVFESSRIPKVVMDATTYKYIDCNPAAVEIYRFRSKEDTLGRTPLDVSAPVQYDGTSSADKADHYIKKAINDGSVIFEWKHQRPEGDVWDAEVHLLSFSVGDQQLLQFSLIDITERKQAEKALRDSEAKYRDLFDSNRDGIIRTKLDGSMIEVNQMFLEMTGYERFDDLKGSYQELTPEKWDDFEAEIVRNQVIERGYSDEYEKEYIHRNGTVFPISIKVWLIKVNDKAVGMWGIVRDITERKRAENELKFQNVLLKTQQELSLDGILIVDENDKIISFNQRFADVWGIPDNIMSLQSGERALEYVLPKLTNPAEFAKRIHDLHINKQEKSYEKITLIDGKILDRYSSPMFGPNDEYYGRIWYYRDITERKRAEQALKQSESAVRKKLQAILEPEGDLGILHLGDIIDFHSIQSMMEDFYRITNFGGAVVDLSGNILVGVEFQDACYKFHRAHPETRQKCLESDIVLSKGIPAGTFKAYKCKNNMWDIATPIMIDGRQLGNIFIGQFFYENEVPDYELFRNQARRYGFDEAEYLAAIDRVPRWSHETVEAVMTFYTKLADMLSSLSYSKIKLSRALAQQKATLIQLSESENKYRTLVENANDIIYSVTSDGIFTYVSPNWTHLLGHEISEVEGHSFAPFVHPDDVSAYSEFLRNVFESGEKQSGVEYRVLHKNGQWRWHTSNASAKRDKNGHVTEYIGIARDITDRKLAEVALKKSETLLDGIRQAQSLFIEEEDPRRSFEALQSIMVSMTDSEFGFLDEVLFDSDATPYKLNLAMSNISWSTESKSLYEQLSARNLEFRNLHNLSGLPALLREPVIANDAQHDPRSGGLPSGHPPIRSFMGLPVLYGERLLGVAGVANRLGGYSEEMVQFMKPFVNACASVIEANRLRQERRKAEKALRESELLLARSQEIANLGSWKLNLTANHLTWSDQVYRIFGYEPQEFAGNYETFLDFVHPDDRGAVDEVYSRSLREGADNYEIEHRIIRKATGEVRFVQERCVHEFDDAGAVIRSIGMVQDITERRQAEEEKEKLQVQLIQAQKMESVGRLAGGVAHDINNKMQVISGYAELIQEKLQESDPIYEFVGEIIDACKKSTDIVNQLLAFARKQTINPKVCDLNEIVKSMLKMLRRLIGEDIDLLWLPEIRLWPIKIDPSQIDQILANLFVNARDAISGVGKITIETGKTVFDEEYCSQHAGFIPGKFVMLAVSDNGCGMNKETLDNVFEPFFTTKPIGKGTGLGLTMIYGIVKQNNGFINVYSEPGKGTTIKIYLPKHSGRIEKIIDNNAQQFPAGFGETILMVEDEKAIMKIGQLMLEKLGYQVLTADTPSKAMHLAKEHPGKIHLLITDVVMPDMNGRDLANQIEDLYPNIKALFMSGYTANVIAHHGVLDKGVHFIQKPFSKKDLAQKLREVLDTASDKTQV